MTAVAVVGWAIALLCAAGWRLADRSERDAWKMHDAALDGWKEARKGWHEANNRVDDLIAMVHAHRTPSPN